MNTKITQKSDDKMHDVSYFNRRMAIGLVFCLPFFLYAQDLQFSSESIRVSRPHEVPDNEYIYTPREQQKTSPAYTFSTPGFSVVQVNVNEDGQNILDDAANEPSIAFNPADPDKMAIGWRQFDNISNNFRQAGFGYTNDGGETWTFPGVIEPGIFRSDPVLDADADGNFFYNSLTSNYGNYWCNVYKSEDGGETWDDGVFAQGGDKQWMTIDKTGGMGSGNIYAFWNSYFSICPPDHFTRSYNGGVSFEYCTTIPNYPIWGTTVVGPEGELYACGIIGTGDFLVAISTTAQDQFLPMTWDYYTSVNLDGQPVGFGGYECPNPDGLLGQAIITVDSSGGPTHGNVYLLCSVQRYSNPDPLDLMFARSTNGGYTWSEPIRINDDPTLTEYQWFGTMSVAPDGRIDVVWLDTRDNPGSMISILYYAYSLDVGETWSENIPLSEPFNSHIGWPNQEKMGDYFDMFSDENGAHLAWAATFNGEQDVYYSNITLSAPPITVSQSEFMDIFTPGFKIDIIEGESGSINIGQTDGPNVYDFSFVDLQDMISINNYEVSEIPILADRYPSEASTIGESTQNINGNPLFLSVPAGTFLIGATTIGEIYQFVHYEPYELFSSFPVTYPASFSQDFDVYDTIFNLSWQIESTEFFNEQVQVEIDGYGTLQVGDLSFDCLRMKREYLVDEYKEILFLTKLGALLVVTDIPSSEPDTGYVDGDFQVLFASDSTITKVGETYLTEKFILEQNFPNPCDDFTEIRYHLYKNGLVTLKIFDITGREIIVLVSENQNAGHYKAVWNMEGLKSGLYYYRLEQENHTKTRKLMVVK